MTMPALTTFVFFIAWLVWASAIPANAASISRFTGADPGEGLDFEGDFAFAVNIGGVERGVIRDAMFVNDTVDGFRIESAFKSNLPALFTPKYGDTDADRILENIMSSFRGSRPDALPEKVTFEIDVEAGQSYKLQMLFAEYCCDRGFDVFLDGQPLISDFVIWEHHQTPFWDIPNRTDGIVITHAFSAIDDRVIVELGTGDVRENNYGHVNAMTLEKISGLRAGDADRDYDFDQADLLNVLVAGKYLTGEPATWGQGDWDGALGGEGDPPLGDGVFDQLDLLLAVAADTYLSGRYAAPQPGVQHRDAPLSMIYNASTGELAIKTPASAELRAINISSASRIFTGEAAQNLGGSFDNDSDANIFKATFGSSFGSIGFGKVAQTGLSEEFVAGDLTVMGTLAGGEGIGDVDLVYVPEPASVRLLFLGLVIRLLHFRGVIRTG